MYERAVAKKVALKYIINSQIQQEDNNRFIQLGEDKISRVRLIGTIVQKFVSQDNTYSFIVIDDGTETIRVRAFEAQTKDILLSKEGDEAEVVGRIREYNGEIYIIPDFVKVVKDPNAVIARNLELIKLDKTIKFEMPEKSELPEISKEESMFKTPALEENSSMPVFDLTSPAEKSEEVINVSEEKVSEKVEDNAVSPVSNIKNVIAKLDLGYGVNLQQIAEDTKKDEESVYESIKQLMKEGDVFEPKPGKFKILD